MYKTASRNLSARANLGSRVGDKKPDKALPSRETLALLKRKALSGETIEGRFVSAVKGGFRVALRDIRNCDAFCPHSQMYPRDLTKKQFAKLQGKSVRFLIVEVKSSSAVVSRRKVAEREGWKIAEKALAERRPIEGRVTSTQEYGVFVDIGGLDGLLHVSEYEHSPTKRFNVGQSLAVTVLRLDPANNRISLSVAQQRGGR